MEIYPTHSPCYLVETDIVEPFETCARDGPNTVVRHQKVLFPSHEDILPLRKVLVVEVRFLGLLGQGTPSWKSCPVLHVRFLGCAPGFVLGLESMFRADDLAFEVGCESWMVFSQAWLS